MQVLKSTQKNPWKTALSKRISHAHLSDLKQRIRSKLLFEYCPTSGTQFNVKICMIHKKVEYTGCITKHEKNKPKGKKTKNKNRIFRT